jgi:dolichol kinase
MKITTTPSSDRVQPLRKLIHLGGASFGMLYLVASRQTVLLVTFTALVLTAAVEWGRQRWPALQRLVEGFLGSALRRGEESQPTAGLWSMLGVFVTLLAFERRLAIPAILYAQLGDPAAEIVGRHRGRHRLPNGKSLEGSLACLAVSLTVGLACCLALPLSPGVAVLGALVATLAEAMPLPVGDNLTMAPLAGLVMALAVLMVG